ncbi:condensation domain-containing protein [Nocardioides sp. Kera G14]|uniref:condensation domain-containing protein n=1 Tax=Nocardioides sp. Kera G14 TaxID=2884264 RepID=UPI001D0FBA3A|nr:condensation domain-containing protein [Nocardioides sp. Kera G14]UDY22375.1 condensation domain-containing protein [Nocardioides sp. Kera G14]
MKETSADLWQPQPGHIMRWTVTPGDEGEPARLGLHQRRLLARGLGAPTEWHAAVFDVDGAVDVEALEQSLKVLVARHSSLQLEVLEAGAVVRHRAEAMTWTHLDCSRTTSNEETRQAVVDLVNAGCALSGYPSFVPLGISRPDRSTIVLAMHQLHCDDWSVPVIADELAGLYAQCQAEPDSAPPMPTSFLAAVGEPAAHSVEPDDPRLDTWRRLLQATDGELPTFPLSVGRSEAVRRPATVVRRLADAEEIDALTELADRHGVSTYAVTLLALANAVSQLGGPERLDALTPVDTRRGGAARPAVGWFTTTAPLSIHAGRSGADLKAADRAVRDGMQLADVPLDEVIGALGGSEAPESRDAFLVSWLDYRHLPGAADAAARAACHVSSAGRADDVQLRLSRTADGLFVRARHPEGDLARSTLFALVDAWVSELRALSADGLRPNLTLSGSA